MTDNVVIKSIVSDERIIAKFSDKKLPRYARFGELYVTDGILYVYTDLEDDGNGRWFPLTNKKDIYTFDQVVQNTTWTIPYTYQTDNLEIVVYDQENKVHTMPFDINYTDGFIILTFEEPARGKAYLMSNKIFKWFGDGIIVGNKVFYIAQDQTDPLKYSLEVNTEFLEILNNGITTFKTDVNVTGLLSVGSLSITGSQIIENGNLNVDGDLIVSGNISSLNITNLTSRILSLEILTSSDDINLDTIQEIVNYIKENRASLTITWDDLSDKPTTLSGYGIIDAYTKIEVDSLIPTFSTLLEKPTTLSGYGITDAYTKSEVDSSIPTFETLSGKPATIDGYGITDAYTKSEVDYFISLVAVPTFENIEGKPTTLSGYGITDAYTKSEVDYFISLSVVPTFETLEGKPTTLSGYGITDAYTKSEVDSYIPTFETLEGKPTTLTGYGITDTYTKIEVDSLIPTFTTLSEKPTTLSGYGITDAYTKSEVDSLIPTFETLQGKPSTVDGYGITDAIKKTNNISLSGYVTGSATFDENGDITIANILNDDVALQDFIDGLNGV